MPRPKKSSNKSNQTQPGEKQSLEHPLPLPWSIQMSSWQDSSVDSESGKLTESSSEFKEDDLYQDPKIIYILRWGILKRVDKWKMSKHDWQYRIFDTTWEVMIVNYDLHDAVPFAKTIMNEVWDFPEIKLLLTIQKIAIVILVISLISAFFSFRSLSKSNFYEKISKIESMIWSGMVQEKIQKPSLNLIPKVSTGTLKQEDFIQ